MRFRDILGWGAFSTIIVVGGMMNASYGWSIGYAKEFTIFGLHTQFIPNWGVLYGVLGVAFDVATALFPIMALIVWMDKSWGREMRVAFVVCCIPFWLVSAGYSGWSASGISILVKSEGVDKSTEINRQKIDLLAKKRALEAEEAASWIPTVTQYKHTPLASIDELIEGKEAQPTYRWSDKCTKATTDKGIQFCDEWHALKYARGLLVEQPNTSARKQAIDDQLLVLMETPTTVDPQIAAMAEELGWGEGKLRGRWSIFMAIAIGWFANFSLSMLTWFSILTDPKRNKENGAKPVHVPFVAEPALPVIAPDPYREIELTGLTPDVQREVEKAEEERPQRKPKSAAAQRTVAKMRLVEDRASVTLDDVVESAMHSLPPGDYDLDRMVAQCVTVAEKIARRGTKVPKKINPGAQRFVKLGAVKLERPKSGDRLIRYRLHSGSEASGDSRIVIAA